MMNRNTSLHEVYDFVDFLINNNKELISHPNMFYSTVTQLFWDNFDLSGMKGYDARVYAECIDSYIKIMIDKLNGVDSKYSKDGYKFKKMNLLSVSIKSWYISNYPTDEMGIELNETISFDDVYNCLLNGNDVYELIFTESGVSDSVIRERIFDSLSQRLLRDYDYIYNLYLNSGKKFKKSLAV